MPEVAQEALAPELQPQLIGFEIPVSRVVMHDVGRELRAAAWLEDHGCRGFYPGVSGTDTQLPRSQKFASQWPNIRHDGQDFSFDWVKFSAGRLAASEGYHLDRSRASGLGEGPLGERNVPEARIWRILVNFHTADRYLAWLDTDPRSLDWDEADGFVSLADDELPPEEARLVMTIPRRADRVVHAAKFCVSQVAHGARETDTGHFLGSWSWEEMV